MIATLSFLDTGPDDGSAYVGDPEAHLFGPAQQRPAEEEALHAVPADLEERMDLMNAALPGERG